MDWPIERKIRWGLGIAVAVLCSLGMIAFALVVSFINTSNWVIHTHLVIETAQGARTALDDAETSVRGYLLTPDQSFLDPYKLVRGRIPGIIERLLILTSDNPTEQREMARLKLQVDRELEILQQAVDTGFSRPAPLAGRRQLLDEDQRVMSNIRNTLREARLRQNKLLSVRDATWRQDLTSTIITAAMLGLLNFVLLGYIYYVFKRDLTKRRRAEADLRVNEERLRLMVASSKDYAFFMLDPQGCVATWNDGAAIIKGYEASDIIGRPFSTFFAEEDRQADKPALALEKAAKVGRVESEGWRVRKDGSRFWADAITSAIRDERGSLRGFSEVTRDLTERKLAEEKIQQSQSRLAAILDGSPSVIFVKDPEGRYTLVNQRFENSFHMKREEVLGKTDRDLFPQATAGTLRAHDAKVLETGRAWEFEEVIPQKEGVHTYLSARVPLLGEDRQPYALCGVSTDITERKGNEREIQRLNRALEDRVVDHGVHLMQAADELKMEREHRQGAEERERDVREGLREVMHSSPVPICTYDLETLAILEVNNAASALHGSSREELLQMRMTDLYPVEQVLKVAKEMKNGGIAKEHPRFWDHRTRDGHVSSVRIEAHRVEWEGRDAALILVVPKSEAQRPQPVISAR